jgi:hypothetical protein
MKVTIFAVALALLMVAPSCQSLPPIVQTEGPSVARFMVKTGTRWALAEKEASADAALRIRGYIVEGRALIADNEAPASALDELAVYLNTKIDNELVRRAIQQGIEFVKTEVEIPVSGAIPAEVKVWVFAVLDGAADGCQEYANTLSAPPSISGSAMAQAPKAISFR